MKHQFIKHITRSFSGWHVAEAQPFQTYLPLRHFPAALRCMQDRLTHFWSTGKSKKTNKTKPLKMLMFILKCYMKSLAKKIFCKQNYWCLFFECLPTSVSSTTLLSSFFILPHPFPKVRTPVTESSANWSSPAPPLTVIITSSQQPALPLGQIIVQPLLWTLGSCHPVSIPSFSLIVFHFPWCWQSWWSVNRGALPQLIQVEGCCPRWGHLVSASPQGLWILSRRSQRDKGGTDSAQWWHPDKTTH